MKNKLLFELHDHGFACHRGYASTLAKALDMLWRRRILQDVDDNCRICAFCRRAKERAEMADALDPLHIPPRPWHERCWDFSTHIPIS
jgi:hypothetical protein